MLAGLESPVHLVIILLIILLLFGAKRLPEVGRSLGRGIQEFKEGLGAEGASEKRRAEAVERGGKPEARVIQEEQRPQEKET